jgi:hypothetical protein
VINKYFYSGAVDEVAIWKKALNVDEISDLFNQGNGAAVPDELANLYYKRSDGSEVSLTGGISNFVNHDEIDIEQISFKGLVYHLQELTEIVCSKIKVCIIVFLNIVCLAIKYLRHAQLTWNNC